MITLFLRKDLPNILETQSRCIFFITLSRAQDQGVQFWQTKSLAIITHTTVPGDCTYGVISQNGDRVPFERLATPRPAPKVTLKSSWHTQQQQPTLKEGVNSISKEIETWESKAGVRDETKNATEVENGRLKQHANSFKSERWYSSQ